MKLLIGGRYDAIGELGSGAFGEVLRVRDEHARPESAELAMKMVTLDRLDDEASKSRFRREIGIAAALSHPHVIEVLDSGVDDDIPWYVMPLADGGSFADFVPASGLSGNQIFDELEPIANAVAYLHRSGVVHRDLSPNNILRFGGIWKVTDFGLSISSALPSSYQTSTGTSGYGSPAFVSPEQRIDLHDATTLSDVYSLGKLLQFVSEGEWPDYPPLPKSPFVGIISRACRHEPRERYHSVDDFLSAVRVTVSAPLSSESIPDRVDVLLSSSEDGRSADGAELVSLLVLLNPNDEFEAKEASRLIRGADPQGWTPAWKSDPERTMLAIENACQATYDEAEFVKLDGLLFGLLAIDKSIADPSVRHSVVATLAHLGVSNDRWSYRKPLVDMLRSRTPSDLVAATISGLKQAGGGATEWILRDVRVETFPQPLRGWLTELV